MDKKFLQINIYVMNILGYKEKEIVVRSVWRYIVKMEEYFKTQ